MTISQQDRMGAYSIFSSMNIDWNSADSQIKQVSVRTETQDTYVSLHLLDPDH